ncbi:DUF4391 domain-containing protein [Prosthecochloris sp. HL-130-GSB]|uniref:DUF4391 domain-containing protein n=1 Tax=Prosthecochloris sp. HL-130-GSB TaxID=1974213 RepID=UPI000A1C147F|nr:DUF4391 domain-containing protein [Prosthecochloris sp. HL-130-GSB]ARM31110.1 methyl-accepting chemotaxis protein [Prosthecochloris sp. HL-130-GSB]
MKHPLFDYPAQAAVGRVLPKSKIYDAGKPRPAVKERFVQEVGQISWAYKLAPETIHVPETPEVTEMQVFSIALRTGTLHHDVLRVIDRSIRHPILFELEYDGQCKVVAAYKRPSEADFGKWVCTGYVESAWLPAETARSPLPISRNLSVLYEQLLIQLLPYPALPGEPLRAQFERMELIKTKEREIAQCEARLRKERQFNRKVPINAALRKLKKELQELRS